MSTRRAARLLPLAALLALAPGVAWGQYAPGRSSATIRVTATVVAGPPLRAPLASVTRAEVRRRTTRGVELATALDFAAGAPRRVVTVEAASAVADAAGLALWVEGAGMRPTRLAPGRPLVVELPPTTAAADVRDELRFRVESETGAPAADFDIPVRLAVVAQGADSMTESRVELRLRP